MFFYEAQERRLHARRVFVELIRAKSGDHEEANGDCGVWREGGGVRTGLTVSHNCHVT